MNNMSTSISRRNLWRYVNRKIKRIIHHYHVNAVITILFEEMLKDLVQGKEIKIANFGTLLLKKTKPRKHHNVLLRQMVVAPGRRLMRFFLTKKIHRKLIEFLDLDKSGFGE